MIWTFLFKCIDIRLNKHFRFKGTRVGLLLGEDCHRREQRCRLFLFPTLFPTGPVRLLSPTDEDAAVGSNAFLKQCWITAGSTSSHEKWGICIAVISVILNCWLVSNVVTLCWTNRLRYLHSRLSIIPASIGCATAVLFGGRKYNWTALSPHAMDSCLREGQFCDLLMPLSYPNYGPIAQRWLPASMTFSVPWNFAPAKHLGLAIGSITRSGNFSHIERNKLINAVTGS